MAEDRTVKAERECPKGHVRTSNNTMIAPDGKEICHLCRIASKAHWKKIGKGKGLR